MINVIVESTIRDNLEEALRLKATYHHGNNTAKVYHDNEWGEHRVKFYEGGKHQKNADYHTDDKDDAHATAKLQLKKMNEETLDEISKERLKDYIKKSSTDRVNAVIDAERAYDNFNKELTQSQAKKMLKTGVDADKRGGKRKYWHDKAVDKLVKD